MFFFKRIIPIILFVITVSQIHAQDVKVRNVTFTQKDELIIIRYDLDGKLNKKYKVDLSLSDDYGVTFQIKPEALRGNVGKNITPGNGKEIIWEMTKDYPNGLEGEGYVFAVDAKLQKSGSKFKFLYFMLGGAVFGDIVAFKAHNIDTTTDFAGYSLMGTVLGIYIYWAYKHAPKNP